MWLRWLSRQLHLCGLGQVTPLSCASLPLPPHPPDERRALEEVMIFQGRQQTGDCWAGVVLPKLLVGPPAWSSPIFCSPQMSARIHLSGMSGGLIGQHLGWKASKVCEEDGLNGAGCRGSSWPSRLPDAPILGSSKAFSK